MPRPTLTVSAHDKHYHGTDVRHGCEARVNVVWEGSGGGVGVDCWYYATMDT